jgi:integrase
MAKEPAKRERGLGRVYQPNDPQRPGQKLQTWHVDYSINGKRFRKTSGSRKKSVALALLRQCLGESPNVAAARALRVTFEDLEEGLKADYKLRGNRSLGRALAAFAHLSDEFAGWEARQITAEALNRYATERLKRAKPATVKYELSILRRAMKGRVRPRPDFPSIAVHNTRVGFFEQGEFEAVVKVLPEPLNRIAVVGYWTGWRKSEILGLRWDRVDFAHGTLRLDPTSDQARTSTKNDEGRVFPFKGLEPLREAPLDPLREALVTQRAFVDGVQRRHQAVIPWVWVREDGTRICKIDEAWKAACKRAELPGRHFHDLRRTAARNLVRRGVAEHVAMKLCGHKTAEVFRRYAIVNEEDLRQAVAKLFDTPQQAASIQVKPAKKRRG